MDNLRKLIRETIQKELEELSSTGSTPGYETPKAFRGTSAAGDTKARDNAEKAGYKIEGPLDEGRSRYRTYKEDQTFTTKQKIGKAISEINRSLFEIDRNLSMNSRLKTETSTQNTELWKRTTHALSKIEGRLLEMVRKIQELKS